MLTPDQINQIRAKSGLAPLNQQPSNGTQQHFVGKYDYLKQTQDQPTPEGFFSKLLNGAKKVISDTKQNFQDIGTTYDTNKNLPATALSATAIVPKAISDAIFEGVKAILPDNVKEEAKKHISSIMENPTIQNEIIQPLMKFANDNPQTSRAAKDVLDIASVLPAAKGAEVGGKVVLQGAENAGKAIAKGSEEVLSKTGNVLEKAGELSVKSAIPLSKAEAGIVQTYKANNPLLSRLFKPLAEQPRTAAITAIEKGLAGSEEMIGIQAKREAVKLWNNTVKPALKGVQEKFDVKSAINKISSDINKISEPSRRNAMKEALTALKEDYKHYSKVSYTKAQEIKKGLDKFMPEKAFNGKPIGSSYKEVQKMLADNIRHSTYKVLDDVGKTEFLDYGNLKKLQEWGQKAMTGSAKKGGFGSFVSSMYDTLTIPARTYGGKVLIKAGKALKK